MPNYPITPPNMRFHSIEWIASTISAISEGQYNFHQSVQNYGGERWEVNLTTPVMDEAKHDEWATFLLQLNGRLGTFTMGDPRRLTPRGIALQQSITAEYGQISATVAADQIADRETLKLRITHSRRSNALIGNNFLVAGDYIQVNIGDPAVERLFKVTAAADLEADNLTHKTIELNIWPKRPTTLAGGETADFSAPKGRWRLIDDSVSWQVNEKNHYRLSFGAVQAF